VALYRQIILTGLFLLQAEQLICAYFRWAFGAAAPECTDLAGTLPQEGMMDFGTP